MLTVNQDNNDTIFYRVRPGDSLSQIIQRYHGKLPESFRNGVISQIMEDNPDIKNLNQIYPDQLIQINIPRQYCSASVYPGAAPALNIDKQYFKPFTQLWQRSTHQEKDMLGTLTTLMLGTGGASMTMIKRTFEANASLLNEMVVNYESYKAGNLSKGQYDYRRYKILTTLKTKLGPLSRMLNATRLQREVLRISRTRGMAPIHNITRQVSRMGHLAKYAKYGGVFLTGLGLGLACNEIINTDDLQEKNEILIENMGGLAGGAAVGLAVLFIATPAGWVAALVIGAVGATTGAITGKIAKHIYTTSFNKIDVLSMTRVDQLCKK